MKNPLQNIQDKFSSTSEKTSNLISSDPFENVSYPFYVEEIEVEVETSEGEPSETKLEKEMKFDTSSLFGGSNIGEEVHSRVEDNTVNIIDDDDFNEDEFFTDENGDATITSRYDLEKAIDPEDKTHFQELERYWVNKPYVFISIFRSTRDNEVKYYAVEPHLNEFEMYVREYIDEKLRDQIDYDQEISVGRDTEEQEEVIEDKTKDLLEFYEMYTHTSDDSEPLIKEDSFIANIIEKAPADLAEYLYDQHDHEEAKKKSYTVRPDIAQENDPDAEVSNFQLDKILYYLKRDYTGYSRIDPIKHDINVEDISCDGYNAPVFVYHSGYEQIISNIEHGKEELDDFVVDLAQQSNQSVSKRNPQVDITLPDGSRGQLTYGQDVSDHGTNYTIRQFKDVPFTPIDLINWKTFSLEQMAFLWLCIQNHKSLIFAGGTASGKTTSLNAVSLFMPSSEKIVSIEDTREVELPQRNWIASVTRSSFSDDGSGVDEFDLLEAALRQRPDYIVMGEIRGEEGRTLFQVMSTGHTTYTTFHASDPSEVLKRFTTDPINVSKTMFTALDLISIQAATRLNGNKVRRNKSLTEISHYDPENDEINVQDVYQWQAETDSFIMPGDSKIIEDIKFDRGWSDEDLELEMQKRELILAYMITEGLNSYPQVAATFQAFMTDPETVLTLIAENKLETALEDLRKMESVLIQVDPKEEENTPRPDPSDEIRENCERILSEAENLLEEYKGRDINLQSVVPDSQPAMEEEESSFDSDLLSNLTGDFTFEEPDEPEIEVIVE